MDGHRVLIEVSLRLCCPRAASPSSSSRRGGCARAARTRPAGAVSAAHQPGDELVQWREFLCIDERKLLDEKDDWRKKERERLGNAGKDKVGREQGVHTPHFHPQCLKQVLRCRSAPSATILSKCE